MDDRLIPIFLNIKSKYLPAERYDLRVSFYKYKNISHTIRLRNGTIFVRLSDKLYNAPDEILIAAGRILFDKLFRYKPDKESRLKYNSYINNSISPYLVSAKTKPITHYNYAGKYYDLELLFNELNHQYFNDTIEKPVLGWSQKKSFRRLAFYDSRRKLLVVSKIFDSAKVPLYVLKFLIYHEILHIKYPVKIVQGRRQIHSKEFKLEERCFFEFEKAQKWLKKKMWRICF